MKFGKRLDILESNIHVREYTPPIIIHTIVEPSESGPKEVGVFSNVFAEGIFKRIDLELGKTQEKYEMELKNILTPPAMCSMMSLFDAVLYNHQPIEFVPISNPRRIKSYPPIMEFHIDIK